MKHLRAHKGLFRIGRVTQLTVRGFIPQQLRKTPIQICTTGLLRPIERWLVLEVMKRFGRTNIKAMLNFLLQIASVAAQLRISALEITQEISFLVVISCARY